MKDIITKQELITLEGNIFEARKYTFGASEPSDLVAPVMTLTVAKDLVDTAKTQLKAMVKPYQEQIKAMEAMLEPLQEDISAKFLETYKEETVHYNKVDEETGEVEFKQYVKDNKGKKMFIYRSEKTKEEIDYEAISYETHPHLYDMQPVININRCEKEAHNLPKIVKTTPASVGFQWAEIRKAIKELPGGKYE